MLSATRPRPTHDRLPGGTTPMTTFDSLLAWLDSGGPGGPEGRDRAGRKYEHIRQRLIKFFTCRGRHDADELADLTIERVTLKVAEIAPTYVGDPALYFYGVAQKVFLESVRRRPPAAPLPAHAAAPPPREEEGPEYACLERCMEELTPANREMILSYHRDDGRAKIDRRREMAESLGIGQNALRIRAHRIRAALERCVRACVENGLPA